MNFKILKILIKNEITLISSDKNAKNFHPKQLKITPKMFKTRLVYASFEFTIWVNNGTFIFPANGDI